MCKWLFSGAVILCFIFLHCDFALAKSVEDEIKELEARIVELERRLDKQQETVAVQAEEIDEIKEAGVLPLLEGINIGAGATFIVQGTHNANGDNQLNEGDDVADASYSIDLEIEKEFDDYGKAFVHLEAGGGAGVEDELTVFSNVNRDADNDENVRLTEVWYEHYFHSMPRTLTVGKIDATCYIDTNEYANDEGGQFLGRIFRNSPTIEFADNAAGVRFALEPTNFMDIELVAMDADSDWEDVFDEMFIAGQLNLKPNFFNRGGNYRLIGWFNDREHTKWLEQAKVTKANFGLGISFDQELSDNVGVFLRYGWQNPEVYANGSDFSLEQSWSAGIQLVGSLWGRDDDVFAIAFGQVMPSDDYKKANSFEAKSEEHLEVYYNFKINDHLTVSPNVQVIWDPYGGDATNGDKIVVVGGLRTQVDF